MVETFTRGNTSVSKYLMPGVLFLGIMGSLITGTYAVIILVASVFFLWALSHYLHIGWYILVALAPMVHWVVGLGHVPGITRIIPYASEIQAPIGDFFALILLIACVIYQVRTWMQGGKILIRAPGRKWMFLFFVSAALSTFINVSGIDTVTSVKYLFRFIVFSYVGFFVLGNTIVNSVKVATRSLLVYGYIGVAAACMGLVSFVVGASTARYGFLRANPFPIGNWAPFGDQHIFLGEILVIAGPILLYLWNKARAPQQRKKYGILIILVYAIALLTFSRTTWIVCALQGMFLWVWFRKSVIAIRLRRWIPIAFISLATVAVIFVIVNVVTYSVRTSTETRWHLTDMALHLFLEHPVVGNGVGTFYPTVMFFDVYQSEIGDVTDAHGVIQKIGAEQGMLGLITFGLWVWWLFSFFYKCGIPGTVSPETRVTSQFATLLAVSAFAFQLFSTQYYSSVLWVPLALSWSMVAMSIREDAYNHGQSKAINFLNT